MKYKEKDIIEFLKESNAIESEYSDQALQDSKKAWDYAVKNARGITTKYVLKIHKLLLQNLRPNIAGKFRGCDVWIGGHRKYFISEALLKEEMRGWIMICDLKNLTKKSKGEKEKTIKEWHVIFESIHPFIDGNGRVGRILYNIHCLNASLPIHIIHTGEEQKNYYQWFK